MRLVFARLSMPCVNAAQHTANVATAAGTRDGANWFIGAWLLAASALILAIAGTNVGWYALAWVDEGVHAFTRAAVTLLIPLYLCEDMLDRYRRHPVALVCTIVSTGIAIGVAREWGEWCYERLSRPANTIHRKADTLSDLLMDAFGALAAGLLLLLALRR